MKYHLTHKNISGDIIFEYKEGVLVSAEFNEVKSPAQREWLGKHLPWEEGMLDVLKKNRFVIRPIAEDLSFEAFWEEYGYKVGKKAMAKRSWERLSKKEKIRAMAYIPVLKNKKAMDGTAMPYASTYINQRYWE